MKQVKKLILILLFSISLTSCVCIDSKWYCLFDSSTSDIFNDAEIKSLIYDAYDIKY